jgi:two-component system OmpR family sensor kinase
MGSERLRQAVDNLLDNATRHAPADSVVDVNASANGTGMITIEVADRGPAFPAEFLPHAFERFHRAEAARTRDGGGTGLGLSIVQAITHAHAGHATAANRPGGGATVTLELPAQGGDPRLEGGYLKRGDTHRRPRRTD